MRSHKPTTCGMIIALSFLFVVLGAGHAADLPPASSGLDIVILVDVSGSMFFRYPSDKPGDPIPGEGSDPQRLRWDAVKLITDLLTPEDRIAVVPFNHAVPAVSEVDQKTRIPGRFADILQSSSQIDVPTGRDSAKQKDRFPGLFTSARLFVPNDQNNNQVRHHYDGGNGTSILEALRFSERLLGESNPTRERSVILLTDGAEIAGENDPTESKLEARLRSFLEVDIPRFIRNRIRIDTIALLSPPDLADRTFRRDQDFLASVSQKTMGAYARIQSNKDLIEVFRRLIVALKMPWVWEYKEFVKPRTSKTLFSRPLQGIVDLGVLCYEEHDGSTLPGRKRVTFPPATRPRIEWSGLENPASRPKEEFRQGPTIDDPKVGSKITGYSYFYYDLQVPQGNGPSVAKIKDLVELKIDFDADKWPITVFMTKRADVRFHLAEPDTTQVFYRYEPIPIRVVMSEHDVFQPDQFELQAEFLLPDGAPLKPPAIVRLATDDLQKTREFTGTVDASKLPSTTSEIDYYTLVVTAKGKDDAQLRLGDGTQVIARRSIAVKNVVPLMHTPSQADLDQKTIRQEIAISSTVPFRGNLPLKLKFIPPRPAASSQPLDATFFKLTQPDGKPLQDSMLLLRDGKAELLIQLLRRPADTLYEAGRIELTATDHNPGNPLRLKEEPELKSGDRFSYRIPVPLSIGTIKVIPTPDELRLTVGPEQARDATGVVFNLDPKADAVALTPAAGLTLQIEKSKGNNAGVDSADDIDFLSDELWIQPEQPNGEPLPAGQRSKRMTLDKLGRKLQVFFEPTPRDNRSFVHRPHRYVIEATGKGFNRSYVGLTLVVQPPEVELKGQGRVVVTANKHSTGVSGRLPAKMKWLPGGEWTFTLRPESMLRLTGRNVAGSLETVEAAYEISPDPFKLRSRLPDVPEDEQWTDLELKLKLPPEIDFGIYTDKLDLIDEGKTKPYATFSVQLAVNGLYPAYPLINPETRYRFQQAGVGAIPTEPARVDSISVVQYFHRAMRQTIVVRNELGMKMDPANLADPEFIVSDAQSGSTAPRAQFLRNSDRDVLALPKITNKRTLPGTDGSALLIDLEFPAIRNADPNTVYTAPLRFKYRDGEIDLGTCILNVQLTPVLSQDVLSRQTETQRATNPAK